MRYGSASIVCAFLAGVGWLVAGGCSGSTNSEFASTGTGVLTGTGGGLTGGTGTGTISTGTIGTGTGTGSTGTGGLGSEDACAAQASDSAAIPSDIFIMLDKSGSMNCPASDDACENPRMPFMPPTRWNAVTDAINGFINAPTSAGIGVGIGFFSLGTNACNANQYAMPNVAIAPLPGSAAAVSNAMSMNMPGGNTPTVPALQGAIQYATTYTRNTPGRTAAVVFVSDGIPNGCNSTVPLAAMAATAAFNAMPQIKTYVIGLGATASLDEIALAGSGGATHYFRASGPTVATDLAAALTKISGTVSCDYVIPTTAVDPNKVNVEVSVGGAMQQLIGKVANAAACGAQGGWFYDVNPPGVPTKITLCPQSCTPLQMTANSKVVVQYGCPSKGPGVN